MTALQEAVQEGVEDVKAGQVVPFDDDFVDNIKRMGGQKKG